MPALDNLAAAFNDVRTVAAAAVERIHYLAHDLAYARASAVDAAVVDQMAADLHATADQLRAAIAAADQSLPQA